MKAEINIRAAGASEELRQKLEEFAESHPERKSLTSFGVTLGPKANNDPDAVIKSLEQIRKKSTLVSSLSSEQVSAIMCDWLVEQIFVEYLSIIKLKMAMENSLDATYDMDILALRATMHIFEQLVIEIKHLGIKNFKVAKKIYNRKLDYAKWPKWPEGKMDDLRSEAWKILTNEIFLDVQLDYVYEKASKYEQKAK